MEPLRQREERVPDIARRWRAREPQRLVRIAPEARLHLDEEVTCTGFVCHQNGSY
jgi:hypothetical protein